MVHCSPTGELPCAGVYAIPRETLLGDVLCQDHPSAFGQAPLLVLSALTSPQQCDFNVSPQILQTMAVSKQDPLWFTMFLKELLF